MEVALHDDDRIDPEWASLAERVATDPCSGPGWIRAWWQEFGGGDPLRLVTVRDDHGLRAVVPLLLRRGSARFPANEHTPVVSILADGPASLRAAARGVMRAARVDLTVPGLHGHEPSIDALRAVARERGHRVHLSHDASSPYLDLRAVEDPLGQLSKKRAAELRRRRRRLTELDGFTCGLQTAPDGLDDLLDRAFAVEARQWKGAAGTAILSSPALERYYRAIALDAARTGRLRLCHMSVGDRLVGFSLDMCQGTVTYGFKIGFDPEFGKYSPGQLLVAEALARAIAAGGTRFEFLGNSDRYKMDWTSTTRPDVTFYAAARGPRGTAAYLTYRGLPVARRLAGRAGRALRREPPAQG